MSSSTSTSLTLRALLKTAVVRLGLGVPGRAVSGLAAAGYTREDPTDTAGEFSARGGVVDFFPAGAKVPVRVEFIGDNIESLRTYDPATQRSIEPIDQAHIEPLQEIVEDDRAATI